MSEADLARAEAEASHWFTRLRRTKISTDELYGFQAWRREPDNAAAFSRVERAWKLSARLGQDPEVVAVTAAALRDNPAPVAKVRWWAIAPAAAAVGLAVIAGAVFLTSRVSEPSFQTTVGEQRLVQLADGSRVRLNTDSAVQVAFDTRERRIKLQRGEAYFEVAHDPARPFIVEAGEANVRAIGTKFDVRRNLDSVKVVLLQGRVQVAHDDGAAVLLSPNQQLDVTSQGVSPVRAADAAQAAGWTTGRLTFRDMTLRDAVAEVNRYAAKKIELQAPAAVGAEPVTGQFEVGDTEAFVTAVSLSFGLKVEPRSDGGVRLVAPAS